MTLRAKCFVLMKSTLGTSGVPSLEFDVGSFASMGLGLGLSLMALLSRSSTLEIADEKTGLERWTTGCPLPSRFLR